MSTPIHKTNAKEMGAAVFIGHIDGWDIYYDPVDPSRVWSVDAYLFLTQDQPGIQRADYVIFAPPRPSHPEIPQPILDFCRAHWNLAS